VGTPRKKIDKVVAVVATLIIALECFPLTALGIGLDWGQLTNSAVIAQLNKALPQKNLRLRTVFGPGQLRKHRSLYTGGRRPIIRGSLIMPSM
jgi:hypothetical protein